MKYDRTTIVNLLLSISHLRWLMSRPEDVGKRIWRDDEDRLDNFNLYITRIRNLLGAKE